MSRMLFYEKLPEMECLEGDTLPVFDIAADTGDAGLAGCSMQLILEDWNNRGTAVLQKECTMKDDGTGFTVQLTSADTAGLCGSFAMHFCLRDSGNLSYRKLAGVLIVRAAAQGGGENDG